jgi:hypothetical protein
MTAVKREICPTGSMSHQFLANRTLRTRTIISLNRRSELSANISFFDRTYELKGDPF